MYIRDFHREQAWMRWVNCARNEISHQNRESVLKMLRTVAHALSAPEYEAALKALQESEEWKAAALLRTWFTKKWLPNHKVNMVITLTYAEHF